MASGESSVYLVKDLFFSVPSPGTCENTQIRGEDVNNMTWHRRSSESINLDPNVDRYFRDPNKRLLSLICNNVLDVHFYKKNLQRLHAILPSAFIRLQIKENINSAIVADKRFELQEILSTGTHIHRLVDYTSLLNGVCIYSIIFGWRERIPQTESVKETQAQPKPKQIKISQDSFTKNLFEREATKDLTIIAGNGTEVKCHRIIFEAHSDVLAAMVSPQNAMREANTGRVEMMENSEVGIRHLIQYLYGMELTIHDLSCDIAVELFKTAHKYKLTELQDCLAELLLNSGKDYFSPDDLLELYFHVKNLDEFDSMREYTLCMMLSLPKEIRDCERFKELKRTDADAATDLVWKFYELK